MTSTAITLLVVVLAAGLAGAAVLHALVAAFEQIPYADERRIAEQLRPDGRPTRAARLAALPDHADNAVSVGYAVLEAVALVAWTALALEIGDAAGWEREVTLIFAWAVAGFFSLVIVRAWPRAAARRAPEAAVRALAPLSWSLVRLTTPIRAVVPQLRIRELSEPEDLVEQAGDALEEEDAELLRSVVSLGDTLTREVMVPRTDMVTIQAGTPARKAMVLFMRSGFSRVPVIRDGVDDIVGVLYLKDVVRATWDHPARLEEPIDSLVREPEFIPESVPADDLLRRMQDEVFHMAVVVDEFGGVAGVVTIEDALEEIVGEVVDEHDRSTPEIEDLGEGRYRVPARCGLDELAELFDVEIDDEDVETVAGLLAKALGKVPIPGSRVTVHGIELLAERAEGRRRTLVSVIATRSPEADAGTGEHETVPRRRGRKDDDDE
ncbi:hemolysin family protein [Demequina mangrovi]|uniref:Hemolysin, contains CBS domains n=1 Tax=Demequina mangrovi TaxID=1043493 RepID=A0A1H6V5L7_9MICO|nr:hemolysin family protein [Demequina mangrovi]SEI95940.1 Hemolysin, contains CBS domains [Demequina mangrovi]